VLNKHFLLVSMLKTVVLLNIFVEIVTFEKKKSYYPKVAYFNMINTKYTHFVVYPSF